MPTSGIELQVILRLIDAVSRIAASFLGAYFAYWFMSRSHVQADRQKRKFEERERIKAETKEELARENLLRHSKKKLKKLKKDNKLQPVQAELNYHHKGSE